jgi:isopentenyl-diphosphate delta-isomerase
MTTPVHTDISSGSVVLLDESGAAIGVADKRAVHGPDTPLHLAFSVYVFDQGQTGQDRLLVTQRALHKTTWPGVWTNTCCGHPAPGEPHADAVRRRVREELGIELDDLRLLLPAFRYRAVMGDGTVENEMCPVYAARTSDVVRPDPEEVAGTGWVPWGAFRAEVLAGTRDVSPWCVEQVTALPAEPLEAPAAPTSELPAAARP